MTRHKRASYGLDMLKSVFQNTPQALPPHPDITAVSTPTTM